jgi:hypothetical protein
MSALRKKLRSDIRFNAFNDAFSFDALVQELITATQVEPNADDISAMIVAPYFNNVYTGFYRRVKELLDKELLSIDELEEGIISVYNRTYLYSKQLANSQIQQQIDDTGFIYSNSYKNVKIPGATGPTYLADGLENHVDSLNILFSYLRHRPRTPVTLELDEDKALHELYSLASLASQAATYKSCYDDLIWQNRKTEQRGEQLHLLAVERELEETIQIGKIRMDQTISNATTTAQTMLLESPGDRAYWLSQFRRNRKPRRLGPLTVVDGYVVPTTQKGFSEDHLVFDFTIHTTIRTYYEYAEQLILPAAGGLRIQDVAILYAELMELIYSLEYLPWKWDGKGHFTYDDLYAIPLRLKETDLKQLLHLKTRYSTSHINAFVELLTHQGDGRIDFWSKPFVKRHDDLLFALLPITGSHILYLVDEWLKAGGFSLDARGPLFEQYLRRQILRDTRERRFFCQDHSGIITLPNGKFEEVDLLIEFRHCLLIAEVKCIGYPLEARDKFNAHKRVVQAANQLNRKANFIKANQHALGDGLAGKPLVKAVLTNYPLFSGLVLAGVPVADATFLHHYIADGNSRRGFTSIDAQGNRDYSKSKSVKYYDDEFTFCQNLGHYLTHPVFVESTRQYCSWQVANTIADLFVEFASVDFNVADL